MPCFQNCESVSGDAGPRYMLHVKKVMENILDSAQVYWFQRYSVSLWTICYCFGGFAVNCMAACISSWHIHSRLMIEDEQFVFGLPELTCSCFLLPWLLLSSACLTCHKPICHLWPQKEGAPLLNHWNPGKTTLSMLCDKLSDWKKKLKLQCMAGLQSARISVVGWQPSLLVGFKQGHCKSVREEVSLVQYNDIIHNIHGFGINLNGQNNINQIVQNILHE